MDIGLLYDFLKSINILMLLIIGYPIMLSRLTGIYQQKSALYVLRHM
jgi:hypothetical protein